MPSLREFLGQLEESGELLKVKESVSVKYDVARVTRDREDVAVIFESIR